jgi:hypothetical protein
MAVWIVPLGESREVALDPDQVMVDVVRWGDEYKSPTHRSPSPTGVSTGVSGSTRSPMSQALRG